MDGNFDKKSNASRTTVARGAIWIFASGASLSLTPLVAQAECLTHMSRVPMAGAAPATAATPSYLAYMLRQGARPHVHRVRPPRAAVARPHVVKATHRRVRKAAAPVVAARTPVPFAVAAQEAAVPAAYALIATTICESAYAAGPVVADSGYAGAPLGPDDVGVPVTAVTPVVPDEDSPPTIFVDNPPPPEGPTLYPPVGGFTPPIEPPLGPPTTPIAGVPEPTTWALFLLGFGAVGAVLRRRRHGNVQPSAVFSCPEHPQETHRESQ